MIFISFFSRVHGPATSDDGGCLPRPIMRPRRLFPVVRTWMFPEDEREFFGTRFQSLCDGLWYEGCIVKLGNHVRAVPDNTTRFNMGISYRRNA